MARPRELVPGDCYFLLNYFDSNLVVPSIQTLTYIGTEQDDAGETMWLFREPSVDPNSADSQTTGDATPLVGFSSDSLYQILDLKGLISRLGGLLDFHPLSGTRDDQASSPRRTDCAEMGPVIERLLASPAGTSVTATIEFTDDGFSMTREKAAVEFSHFISPKTEHEREILVRRIFEKQGAVPEDDYLADGGKTRVLSFSVNDKPSELMVIATRLLCEVYSMRVDDSISTHFREPLKR